MGCNQSVQDEPLIEKDSKKKKSQIEQGKISEQKQEEKEQDEDIDLANIRDSEIFDAFENASLDTYEQPVRHDQIQREGVPNKADLSSDSEPEEEQNQPEAFNPFKFKPIMTTSQLTSSQPNEDSFDLDEQTDRVSFGAAAKQHTELLQQINVLPSPKNKQSTQMQHMSFRTGDLLSQITLADKQYKQQGVSSFNPNQENFLVQHQTFRLED